MIHALNARNLHFAQSNKPLVSHHTKIIDEFAYQTGTTDAPAASRLLTYEAAMYE